MGLHLFFLAIHLLLAAAGDPIVMSVSLLLHCVIYLINAAFSRREGLTALMPYAINVGMTAVSNMWFVFRLNKYGLNVESMYSYVVVKYISEATVLCAVGYTSVFIGYEYFSKRSFPKLTVIVSEKRTLDIIFRVALLLAVLNFSGYLINLGKISGGFQKILTLFNDMSVLFFARLWGKEENKKYRNYAMFLCLLRVLIALFTSYLRLELIQPFIVFFGGYFLGKGDIRYVFSYRIFPALAVMFAFSIVFASLGSNRSQFIKVFTEEEADQQSVSVAPSYAVNSIKASDRNNVLIRVGNVAQLSNVFDLVERHGFYGGRASAPLAFAFIPRFLWPDKPVIELGSWFALEIGVAIISPLTGRANNSVNMTIPGQLYLDFGYPGVVIGCFFIGMILALFWNAGNFGEPYNIFGTMWGGYILFISLLGFGADLQIIVTVTSTYLAFMLVRKLIGIYANTERRAPMERQ